MSRRLARPFAALASAATLAFATVAGAHPLVTDSVIPVGQPATVNLGVPGETPTPMVRVDITIPPGFRLEEAVPVQGWATSREGQSVTYRSSEGIAPGGFAIFALRGVAERKAILAFAMTTHAADGTTQEWSDRGEFQLAPKAYAGYDEVPGSGDQDGIDWALVAGVFLIGVGVAGAIARFAWQRRGR